MPLGLSKKGLAGAQWLQSGSKTFIWTNASTLETGFDVLGRPNTSTAGAGTQLRFTASGLSPWQSTDKLEYYVSNANIYALITPSISPGVTTVNQAFTWTGTLTDGTKGDLGYLTQLVTKNIQGNLVVTLGKVFSPINIVQASGTTTTISGTLLDIPQTSTVRANIKESAFFQMLTNMHPAAVADRADIYVSADPAGGTKGFIGATSDFIYYSSSIPLTTDIDLGDISYGNPFPANWTPFASYYQYAKLPFAASGAVTSADLFIAVGIDTPNLPSASSPAQPIIGTILLPTINGSTLFTTQTGVGTTPVIAWNPPTLGTATGYRLLLIQLVPSGGTTTFLSVASLYTTATSIKVPPGLLVAGNKYCIRITAESEAGVNYLTGPFRHGFPRGFAMTVSGVISP